MQGDRDAGCKVQDCRIAGRGLWGCRVIGMHGAGVQGAGGRVQHALAHWPGAQGLGCWGRAQRGPPGAGRLPAAGAAQGGEQEREPHCCAPRGEQRLCRRALSTHRLSGASHVNPGSAQPALSSFT